MPKFLIYARLALATGGRGAGRDSERVTYVVEVEQVSAQAGGEVVVDACLLSTQKMRHGGVSCLCVEEQRWSNNVLVLRAPARSTRPGGPCSE
jgi:hypothetical protein